MKVYFAILSAQFRILLQYRAAAWAGFGTQLFWGLIRITIFTAFYQSTKQAQPISQENIVTYLWLIQGLFALTMWGFDLDVRQMIRDGTVAYEMLRPIDLYWLWFSRAVAARIAPTVLRSLPLVIFAGLFFGLQLPASCGAFCAFLFSLVGASLIVAGFSVLLTTTLIRTIAADGIARLGVALTLVLSGMSIPIPLMPEKVQFFVNLLPFRNIIDSPIRLYMGHIPLRDCWQVFLHEAVWVAILVLWGRWFLSRTQQHLVVQGG